VIRLQDIMTTDVETIRSTTPAEEAYERMRAQRIHHLVVLEDHRVVGVVSERDLGGARGASLRRNRLVSEVMSAAVVTAPADATLRQAANLMRGRGIECLPVVDGPKLVGIITVTDLLNTVGRGLERPMSRGKRWALRTEPTRWRGPLQQSRGVR